MGGRSEAKKKAGAVGKGKEGKGVVKVKKSVGAPEPRRKQKTTASEPEEHATQHKRAKGLQQQVWPEDSPGSGSSEDSGSESGGEAGDIPFGELQQLRQDGSTTAEAMKARAAALRKSGGAQQFKREGKHRPMEAPSKKPVPVFREVFQGGKREVRDPRFESLSGGQYDDDKFKKQYAFLYDEKLPEEGADLKAQLAKTKSLGRKEQLKAQLVKVEQQMRNEEQRRRKASFQEGIKAKERASVVAGKRPYYLKKGEVRRQELVAQYQELKASGGLGKFMEKRRKKNAAKDHRYLPSARRDGGE